MQEWCIPEVGAEFVAPMEDVLDLYEAPYDPARPVVCFDESPKQLIGDVREPMPPHPGTPAREDTEYQRNGVRDLMMICEPKRGWRDVLVMERRTKIEFAHCMRHIVQSYPDAEVIRVVLDNLNTHKAASLYEAFPPEEARAIARKLEFHYTPKHGSWLNIAEIELAVLSNMCLSQRIPDEDSRKIRHAFTEFPNWKRSEKEFRDLRKKVTIAIFGETDDLDRVTALVDELFTLLEKADRI